MVSLPEPLPLFVLTGFLGSGKTTILQRILRSEAGARTAILINEYGQVGLDHRIVTHVAELSAIVQNGCLCCSVKPELTRALLDLLRRRLAGETAPFDRIIIETSGLSDPAPIINTIQTDTVLREHVRVAGVITTVDAANALASENHAEFSKQIAVADTILVTKTDLVSPTVAADLSRRLRSINPVAEIGDARDPDLDLGHLVGRRGNAGMAEVGTTDSQDHGVRTFSITYDRPVDWSAFVTWLSLLLNRHGHAVLRMKGLLNVAEESAPILVHGVQHIMHAPEHMSAWPDEDRRSHVVFIVKAIDPDRIRASLSAFLGFVSRDGLQGGGPKPATPARSRSELSCQT